MECDRRPNHSNMNGLHRTPPEVPCGADKKRRNYKLIVDPQIHIYKGNQKIYRFDGISPDGTVVEAKDPRLQRIWYRRQPADLPVPQFKYDQYYVGTPPPKEVTFTNLNDNINKDFLENMCKGYGKIEEVRIYYNPKNRKHLGVGKVVYSSSKAAKLCAEKLNRTSKMGNIMNVFVDTLGKERQRIIEEKLVERARIELPNNRRDRNNGFGAGNSTEAYDPDDFEYGGGSLQSQFSYPPSESGFGSHSSDMGFSSGTPYSQATFTPGSMYGGDMQGSGYTPASEMNYSMHHQPHHHHQHHHHHHHHQQQQPPHTPYSMPPPPHQPPPHFNNSFVNFDPKVPPPPLPSEPPPLTPSGPYQQHAIKTPSDHGHHERSRSRETDPDWHRSKHHDRDCEIDRDHEWEREKDKERERHRDRDRDRDKDRKHKGRDGNGVAGCSSRADSSERPHSLPKPPADKHARPKTPEDEPEEEPRFMSLESRIQSLLRGSASLEDDPLPQPVSRPQEHPLATPGTPHTPSTPSDMRQLNDSSNSSFNNGGWVAQGAGDAAQQTPVPPEADKDDGSDMDVVDDDDDRMSLSSISSGEERLQVNQPITSNLSSSGMSLGLFTQPPPIGLWQTSGAPFEFNSFGGKNFLGNSGPFNQGFSGAPFTNGVVDQTAHLQADFAAKEEEHKKIDKQFVYVLNQFVSELKAVMQKDLCKKMVENSAFKAFESWWDGEEQKSKAPSKAIMPLADKAIEKPTKPLVPNATEGISSTIASLFESRHPWTKEGGLESGFGFSAFGSGGLLGIRGSMPRLPSFKKKFRPPSPSVDESTVQHKPDKTQDTAEAESDVDQETSQSPKPPANRRVIYSSDSDEESDDDKEVSAVEDEEEEDEEEEEEEEESGVSEDSEEEDEDDDEEEEESDLSAVESEDEEGAKIRTKPIGEVEDAEDESLDADRSEIDEEKEEDESDDADSEADLATDQHKKEDLLSAKTGAKENKVLVNRDSQKDLESKPKETSSPSVKEKDDNFVQEQARKNKEDKQSRDSAQEEEEDIDIEELENSYNRDSKHVMAEAAEKELAEISRSHIISEGIKLPDKKRADECQEKKSSDETNNVPARFSSDISISPLVKSQETVLANTASDDKLASVKMLGIPEPTVNPREVKPVETSSSTSSSTMDIVMKEEEVSVSVDEEEEESRPYIIPAIAEHDYFAVPPSGPVPATMTDPEDTDSAEEDVNSYCQEVWMEHSYSLPIMKQEDFDADAGLSTQDLSADAAKSPKVKKAKKPEPFVTEEAPVSEPALKKGKTKKDKVSEDRDVPEKKQRKVKKDKLVDITNKGVRELAQLLPEPVVPKPPVTFEIRNMQEEREVFFDIYHRGIDEEDITYLKRTYDELMLSEDPMFYWLNDILWVDHPFTNIPDPPRKRRKVEDSYQNRPHRTGSARTDGYYKLTLEEKARYLSHARNVTLQQKAAETLNENLDESKKKAQTSREVRSETRRLQSTFSEYLDMGDLFKFNQLKTRKKLLRFAKSGIHDWGLFALEPIAADEMVIEYVGSVVRQSVAELREKQYERSGIGSSYLFRVDHETIIDATMNGNLARFINHSCNPNCYAKVITMESQKKIVIYSKRDIDVNEEITYDYKFPIEDEKIPCLCGAPNCRGTLN